jgi:radical SAM superfamily enzyme
VAHNISIIFSVIVGFPGESQESVLETLEVVKRLRKIEGIFL